MNRIYHVTITRPDGNQRTADQLADTIATEKQAAINAVGGQISVSRTFRLDMSMIVVNLPETVDIGQFFTEGVKEYDAASVAPTNSDNQ